MPVQAGQVEPFMHHLIVHVMACVRILDSLKVDDNLGMNYSPAMPSCLA